MSVSQPSLRAKILLLLLLFGIVTIYKGEKLVGSIATLKENYRPSRVSGHEPDVKIVRQVKTLDASADSPGIATLVSSKGIIDARTDGLVEQASKRLRKSNWWLSGKCDCDSRIWNSIVNVEQTFGRIVSMKEYWSQVYVSRTIVTLCHADAVKESSGRGKISLLTQGTPSRRHMLRHLIDSWSGPINAALYVKHRDFKDNYHYIKALLEKTKRRNVIIHIVLSTGSVYPVNWLRNVVIKNTTSEYIFSIDMDFIPSKNLMEKVSFHINSLKQAAANNVVILVPALEMLQATSEALPLSKSEIFPVISSGKADVFHRDVGGHALWLIDKWLTAERPYLLPQSTVCDDKSEPYVVVLRSASPLYPETLLERGKNKIAYYHELCTYRYNFLVIHDGFLLHKWHTDSLRAMKRVKHCVEEAFRVFKLQLNNSAEQTDIYERLMSSSTMRFLLGLKCTFIDLILLVLFLLPFFLVFIWYYRRYWHKTPELPLAT